MCKSCGDGLSGNRYDNSIKWKVGSGEKNYILGGCLDRR